MILKSVKQFENKMKYFICDGNEPKLNIKHQISRYEFYKIKNITKELKYYLLSKSYMNIAVKNGLLLEEFFDKIKSIKANDITPETYKNINIESNCLMLNYLVSFRTFVDNLENYDKKIKNDRSFKTEVLSKIYDTEPIYSFFTKLRNFATHYNVVFDILNINQEKNNIELVSSKKHLLEYDEWKEWDLKFIKEYKGNLDYEAFVKKNNVLIMAIYQAFLIHLAPNLEKIHTQIGKIIKKYKIINPCLLSTKDTYNLKNSNIYEIGLNILSEASKELSELPGVNIQILPVENLL